MTNANCTACRGIFEIGALKVRVVDGEIKEFCRSCFAQTETPRPETPRGVNWDKVTQFNHPRYSGVER